jgi:uncharacterized protein YbjT (DUF2867 family)
MSRKTVTVFGATGTAGSACVDEPIRQDQFKAQVLARKGGQLEKTSMGPAQSADEKRRRYTQWSSHGVVVRSVDVTDHAELIPALRGTDYLASCVPYSATESQYPLIFAAREAGVERFVPSEFGAIYELEQFWPTDTVHRAMARQKAFIRRVIELAGLDFTIIPAGLWPEYYLLEPVAVMGDGEQKVSWSTGRDVGRIIPHVLAHPLSRNRARSRKSWPSACSTPRAPRACRSGRTGKARSFRSSRARRWPSCSPATSSLSLPPREPR